MLLNDMEKPDKRGLPGAGTVIIFVRVSGQGQDYDRQVSDLRKVGEAKGWPVSEVISEKVSGYRRGVKREGLERLLDLVEKGKVQKVLVSEVSRIGRVPSQTVRILEDFTAKGVSIYVHNVGLETLAENGKLNPAASMMFTLFAEFARAESQQLSERVKSGMEEARRKGVHLGRPAGAGETEKVFLSKYGAVAAKLAKGFSIRDTARLCQVSKNTVFKVRKLVAQK